LELTFTDKSDSGQANKSPIISVMLPEAFRRFGGQFLGGTLNTTPHSVKPV